MNTSDVIDFTGVGPTQLAARIDKMTKKLVD